MKLLMENWRKFVKVEQDAGDANELIKEAANQFLGSNPKLLKEFIGPGNPMWDDEEEEEEDAYEQYVNRYEEEEDEDEESEEADEVIDSVEDEMIGAISASPAPDEEGGEVDAEAIRTSMRPADTSHLDQASADAEEFVSATMGRLAGYILGTTKTLTKIGGKSAAAIVDTAVGGAKVLRALFPDIMRGATDIAMMFPEAAQEVVKSWKEGKDVKELAETNPEGFTQALKTLEERIFELKLPGVEDANTAAVFLHQSKKGPRKAKKDIKKAIKNAATESELSTPEILGLLAAYTAFASHATKVASKQAQATEDDNF
tara:strand:+ start:248 stop:1195 length:948 start_codon:yes stop_codon:yes gene_type:complete